MVIVQITFQQGCELQKHPQNQNVQDMIKILCNVENVQCLILGLTDLTLNVQDFNQTPVVPYSTDNRSIYLDHANFTRKAA